MALAGKRFVLTGMFPAASKIVNQDDLSDATGRLDIGKATEQLFMIKPEQLDIREQEIVRIDMSEDGRRAKTLTRARYRRLNLDGDLQEKDLLLYWIKRR